MIVSPFSTMGRVPYCRHPVRGLKYLVRPWFVQIHSLSGAGQYVTTTTLVMDSLATLSSHGLDLRVRHRGIRFGHRRDPAVVDGGSVAWFG